MIEKSSYFTAPRQGPAEFLNDEQLFLFTEEERLSAGLSVANRIMRETVYPVKRSREYVWLGVQPPAQTANSEALTPVFAI